MTPKIGDTVTLTLDAGHSAHVRGGVKRTLPAGTEVAASVTRVHREDCVDLVRVDEDGRSHELASVVRGKGGPSAEHRTWCPVEMVP
jgi:hypothetical protein